jgi:uncharacterized membrane protein YidH (DUF202 family)
MEERHRVTRMSERTILSLTLTLIVTGFIALSVTLSPVARTAPLVVGVPTFALVAVALWRDVTCGPMRAPADPRQRAADERRLIGWLGLLLGLTAAGGIPLGVPFWFGLFLRFRSQESWTMAVAFSSGLLIVLVVVFTILLRAGPMSGSVLTWSS